MTVNHVAHVIKIKISNCNKLILNKYVYNMFEHFKKYLADKHNQKVLMIIGGFIVFLMILNHFDLLETFENISQKNDMMTEPEIKDDKKEKENENIVVDTTSVKLKSV
jgi:hypothetical protein